MKPKWQKLASLAQEYAHSSFSSLVQSLLPKDTLLRTYQKRQIDGVSTNRLLDVWKTLLSFSKYFSSNTFSQNISHCS